MPDDSKHRHLSVAIDLFAIEAEGGAAPPADAPETFLMLPYWEGEFPGYGPLKIDRAYGERMAENFRNRVTGREISLDLNHEKRGSAPGWIRDIQVTDQGIQASVRWTNYGKRLVSDGEYRYVSAEWHPTWQRGTDGQTFECVLTGCSLTNRPFFDQLPPLTLLAEDPCIMAQRETPMKPELNADGTPVTTPSADATNGGGLATAVAPVPALQAQPPAAAPVQGVPDTRVADLEAQLAEQRTQLAALQAREARTGLIAELRDRKFDRCPGARLSPAQAEVIADIVLCVPDTALQAEAGQPATTRRRQATDALLSIVEAGLPIMGERGANMQPSGDYNGADPGEKRAELHRLATEMQASQQGLEYEAACSAVLRARPDLG